MQDSSTKTHFRDRKSRQAKWGRQASLDNARRTYLEDYLECDDLCSSKYNTTASSHLSSTTSSNKSNSKTTKTTTGEKQRRVSNSLTSDQAKPFVTEEKSRERRRKCSETEKQLLKRIPQIMKN